MEILGRAGQSESLQHIREVHQICASLSNDNPFRLLEAPNDCVLALGASSDVTVVRVKLVLILLQIHMIECERETFDGEQAVQTLKSCIMEDAKLLSDNSPEDSECEPCCQ